MVLADAIELLDGLDAEQREILLVPLLEMMTSPTHHVILNFQLEYQDKLLRKEFVKSQNQIIKKCVDIELTEYGKAVRKIENLEPLTLETDINITII